MAGKLIIIEAGDGCGKATQTARLYERLVEEKYPVKQISFPNYHSPSSALLTMYLQGQFGSDPEAVNAYAASTFFAVDRYASYKTDWGSWYREGGILLSDRYTTSNMVHQAVKIADPVERETFLDWLWDMEFVKFGLPKPDLVLFLDVPPHCSNALLATRQSKDGSTNKDIHERDTGYLARCYHTYRLIADKYGWQCITCMKDDGQLKGIEDIHQAIYSKVKDIL